MRISEHDCVDDTENRLDGPDSDRERLYRDERESGMLEQQAVAVSHILQKHFHETTTSNFVSAIFDAAQVPETLSRSPLSILIGHSDGAIGIGFHFQVRSKFVIDVVKHGIATDQCAYPVEERLHVASLILATTNARRSQDASSSVSCFSPVLVSV